jgi:hypothetical protein
MKAAAMVATLRTTVTKTSVQVAVRSDLAVLSADSEAVFAWVRAVSARAFACSCSSLAINWRGTQFGEDEPDAKTCVVLGGLAAALFRASDALDDFLVRLRNRAA